jgi:hypothetical protein
MAMRRAIMPSAPYCRRGFSIARRTPRTGPFDHFHGLRALRVSLDARAPARAALRIGAVGPDAVLKRLLASRVTRLHEVCPLQMDVHGPSH